MNSYEINNTFPCKATAAVSEKMILLLIIFVFFLMTWNGKIKNPQIKVISSLHNYLRFFTGSEFTLTAISTMTAINTAMTTTTMII